MKKSKIMPFAAAILLLLLAFCLNLPYIENGAAGYTINTESNITSSLLSEKETLVVPQTGSAQAAESTATTEEETSAPASLSYEAPAATEMIENAPQPEASPAIPTPTAQTGISQGPTVQAAPVTIYPPDEAIFGEYYEYAQMLYQQHLTGNYEDIAYCFSAGRDTAIQFLDAFNSCCLKTTGLTAYYSYISTSGNTAILHLSKYSVQAYQDLMYIQQTIQNIVGTTATQREVVERITDWCIAHCTYDYSYQVSSAADLLRQHTGVCAAYTDLLWQACNLYRIPCQRIAHTDRNHVWNRVEIDGVWYYTDITWSVCRGYNAYPLSTTLWANHQ